MQGTDAITATSHSDEVIDEDPCSQLMDGEDKMVESPSSTMPAAHISSPHFKSWIYEIDGEAAYNTLDKDDEPLNDPDDDEVNTADTSFTQPHKGQHQLQGVILHCGYKTHGIFCECLATVSKRNITYVVPFGMMKSVEITQKEYDKFYETTANTDSHSISKEQLKQYLLQIIDQKKRLNITDGHLFIRELLWEMEDIHTDENAQDMIMMMIETATQRSLHPLNDPTDIPHQIKEMIEEKEDDPEEEPLRIPTTKKEVKKAQLDTLYPTPIVFSQHETQKTTLSPIHENAYQEDMLTVTLQEDVLPVTFQGTW